MAPKGGKEKEILTLIHQAILQNAIQDLSNKIKDLKDKDRDIWHYGVGSPLHSAAGFGKIDCLKILLDNGFNINAKLHKGNKEFVTALAWAVAHKRASSVKILLQRGADPNIFNHWLGKSGTALELAKKKNDPAIIKHFSQEPGSDSSSRPSSSASSDASHKPQGKVKPTEVHQLNMILETELMEEQTTLMKAQLVNQLILKHQKKINDLIASEDYLPEDKLASLEHKVDRLRTRLTQVKQVLGDDKGTGVA